MQSQIQESMKIKNAPRFSKHTLPFLAKASRQKNPAWLEKNRSEYEDAILLPLQRLAQELKEQLSPLAPGYHFPTKGIGRIRRASHRIEKGNGPYKGWLTYSSAPPRKSRFDHNPNLFLLFNSHDAKDGVLVAGGLYMPSSRQLRAIRESIANDASAFDRLFKSKEFSRCFPGGFSDEKISSRCPRGFDPEHPRMSWLRLQAYFVWRPYAQREFTAAGFPQLVARDWKQILRLNELLQRAIQGRLVPQERPHAQPSKILERLSEIEQVRPAMDF
jgi:uncharacterized protein (TIGR02453 family)